jgi:hypothetical protein
MWAVSLHGQVGQQRAHLACGRARHRLAIQFELERSEQREGQTGHPVSSRVCLQGVTKVESDAVPIIPQFGTPAK